MSYSGSAVRSAKEPLIRRSLVFLFIFLTGWRFCIIASVASLRRYRINRADWWANSSGLLRMISGIRWAVENGKPETRKPISGRTSGDMEMEAILPESRRHSIWWYNWLVLQSYLCFAAWLIRYSNFYHPGQSGIVDNMEDGESISFQAWPSLLSTIYTLHHYQNDDDPCKRKSLFWRIFSESSKTIILPSPTTCPHDYYLWRLFSFQEIAPSQTAASAQSG